MTISLAGSVHRLTLSFSLLWFCFYGQAKRKANEKMADSNHTSNAVVLPVDNSEHSERAFKCMYTFVTLSFHFDETIVEQLKGQRHKVQY